MAAATPSGGGGHADKAADGAATLTGSKNTGPLGPKLTFLESAFCGSTAGVVARFVVAPLDVVKIRLQLQAEHIALLSSTGPTPTNAKYTSISQCAKRIVREEGITALWKGNMPAEYLYVTYGAVQFVVYQKFADLWRFLDEKYPDHAPPRGVRAFIGGAAAGTLSTIATYPFDLLRTRFAAQGERRIYSGVVPAVRQIRRQEGLAGLYKGLWPSVLQIMPYMGLVFGSYDWMRKGFSWARSRSWWSSRLDAVLGKSPSAREELISGALSGTFSKIAVYPVDTIRKRMQIQGPTQNSYAVSHVPTYPKSVKGVFAQILRDEGPLALYKGLTPAILKAAPASAITFLVYERTAIIIKALGL